MSVKALTVHLDENCTLTIYPQKVLLATPRGFWRIPRNEFDAKLKEFADSAKSRKVTTKITIAVVGDICPSCRLMFNPGDQAYFASKFFTGAVCLTCYRVLRHAKVVVETGKCGVCEMVVNEFVTLPNVPGSICYSCFIQRVMSATKDVMQHAGDAFERMSSKTSLMAELEAKCSREKNEAASMSLASLVQTLEEFRVKFPFQDKVDAMEGALASPKPGSSGCPRCGSIRIRDSQHSFMTGNKQCDNCSFIFMP